MSKPPFYLRIPILMAILCLPPIGATEIGLYFCVNEVGLNCWMVVGAISVTVAGYLMYIKDWRDFEDD